MSSKIQRGEILNILLAVVSVTGIIGVGVLAPGLLKLIAPYVRNAIPLTPSIKV